MKQSRPASSAGGGRFELPLLDPGPQTFGPPDLRRQQEPTNPFSTHEIFQVRHKGPGAGLTEDGFTSGNKTPTPVTFALRSGFCLDLKAFISV